MFSQKKISYGTMPTLHMLENLQCAEVWASVVWGFLLCVGVWLVGLVLLLVFFFKSLLYRGLYWANGKTGVQIRGRYSRMHGCELLFGMLSAGMRLITPS